MSWVTWTHLVVLTQMVFFHLKRHHNHNNSLLKDGEFSSCWKLVNITSIFKEPSQTQFPSDYSEIFITKFYLEYMIRYGKNNV